MNVTKNVRCVKLCLISVLKTSLNMQHSYGKTAKHETDATVSATVLTKFTLQPKGLGDLVDSDKRGVSNSPQDVWQNTGRLGPEIDSDRQQYKQTSKQTNKNIAI